MLGSLPEFFKEQEIEYAEQFDISKISHIKIGGVATFAAMPSSLEKLINLVEFLKSENIAYKVAGGMSNLLSCNAFFNGVLIITTKCNKYTVAERILTLECGVRISKMIYTASKLSLGGMESLCGIPGTVGGMVRSNAGAYGKSVSDFLLAATLYSPDDKKIRTLTSSEMDMSYRHSRLSDSKEILLTADFLLQKCEEKEVLMRIREITEKRRASQPTDMPSLGSIFKRCADVPISLLIDKLGLKGVKIGGAQVSEKHAGFIINSGNATAVDVLSLISYLKDRIYREYGFVPEEEIETF